MLVKRRCFCNNCGTEFRFQDDIWNDDNCPVCGNDEPDYELITIPDYETPQQYEKRTGKKFPDSGAVWGYFEYKDKRLINKWKLSTLERVKHLYFQYVEEHNTVIADPPFPPPDDWKPEEVK
jgi:hypothetical protein